MLELLFQFVMGIVSTVSNIFMAPISSAVSSILPGFSNLVSGFFTFLSMGLGYVSFFCKLFMIPSDLFLLVISMGLAIFSFNAIIKSIMLTQAVYHYFKP